MTLNKELQKEQPNIKEITDKIVKQQLEEQQKYYKQQIKVIEADLANRVEKVL